ncbi:ATP-binding protein [Herbiconiux sp. KACC 21604]|uniref:ATP-binding protein n=1 Tax=unclassified Herbiconiux TaxID=2618217 RepID=UPI0014928958|nr:ATP-binding protein [Herbiconiux sp. SALV-R1]QJU52906.1 ATP-binding protein [Herbiconiux sp. SALV-R1]WPO87826.1 ATP-binding protein [Herbiconiux sp. KACC 21604]
MTVILIDGPSGSGKTALAHRVLAEWSGADRPTLVHLDDIYPGWDGLDAASAHVAEHLLRPLRAGLPARWQRWDWAAHRPAKWTEVDPAHPLVIEGCGAMSADNAALADLCIWVEADDGERKRRALARDGELYAREWDRWERQWRRFVQRENPRARATVVVPT